MQGFTPEQMQIISNLLDEQVGTLQRENDQLRQQISILSDGTSIKRSDYQDLEDRYRKEQEESMKLNRELNDMKSKYAAAMNQNRILETQVNSHNKDVNTSTQALKTKDDKINQLQEEIKQLDQRIMKQKLDLSAFLMEKTDMQQKINDLCQQNLELQNVTQELIEKDNQLVSALSDNATELADKERQIDDLEKKIRKLESKIPSKENTEIEIPLASTTEITESQTVIDEGLLKKYQDVKAENRQLNSQLRQFSEDIKRIERLQTAVEKKKKEIDILQQMLDKSEQEKRELHQIADQFSIDLKNTKDKLSITEQTCEEKVKAIEREIQIYKERFDHDTNHREALEVEVVEKTKEINELRETNQQLERGEFGLSQAVTQIKELKAMIDLRDKSITHLVRELNTMDKIIDGLAGVIQPDFDVEKFIVSVEDDIAKAQDNRLMIASRELNKRLDDLRHKRPHSQIKIIIENKEDQDMHMTATLYGKNNDIESGGSAVPSNFVTRDLQNDYVNEEEDLNTIKEDENEKTKRASFDEFQSSSLPSDSYSIESFDRTSQERLVPPKPEPVEVEYADIETQCRPETSMSTIPTIKPEPKPEDNTYKDWIENMKRDYKKAVQQTRDLSMENDELKAKVDKLFEEKKKLQDQLARKDDEKKDHEEEEKTLRMTIDRMELENEKTRIKANIKAKLYTSATFSSANIPAIIPNKLQSSTLDCLVDNPSDPLVLKIKSPETISILPSEAELKRMRAKEDAANEKVKQATTEIVSLQRLVADSQTKLDQKDRTIKERDQTINRLEKNMQDEREKYKERIHEITKQAQDTMNAQMREALDPSLSGVHSTETDYRKLPEVSEYINNLKRENNSLKERNEELQQLFQSIKNDAESLRVKVKQLEAERNNNDDENKPDRDENQQTNMEYMRKLQRQNSELKKKIMYYSDENEKLRALRERKEIDDRKIEDNNDNNSQETIEKLTLKNKTIAQKYNNLKQAHMDQAAALEKEKQKGERLKSALQKKEETVQLLTEKNQRYKHQNEKLKALINKKKEGQN
ncbi:hypothetical protein TVAG_263280 [Trichomonas vaginalis G3]|uniref:Uncharacterized protein n=1 Tax=Trichomonas vaginalis (strain ATCC PRA-98 / G3) TaxID=412133 RepID=A2FA75_TRIV3|nr:centrosomal protein of 290 kDa family [Trichomonas vaginalis G3]EAX98211.1 hypothetical protein TVAG_263280 [Trichomonas vaginalis G3]KAI5533983.1 centrosomal protein of 290 kDa family [Trichomonas vaginalis G3]|eukprot:XP_001311141.1 hypothetical protein [Trichomonas vaginalis G3]